MQRQEQHLFTQRAFLGCLLYARIVLGAIGDAGMRQMSLPTELLLHLEGESPGSTNSGKKGQWLGPAGLWLTESRCLQGCVDQESEAISGSRFSLSTRVIIIMPPHEVYEDCKDSL